MRYVSIHTLGCLVATAVLLFPAHLWAAFTITAPSATQTYAQTQMAGCSGSWETNAAGVIGFGVMNPTTGAVTNQSSIAVTGMNGPGGGLAGFWAANIPAPPAPGWTKSVTINFPIPFPPYQWPMPVPDKGFSADSDGVINTKGTHIVY